MLGLDRITHDPDILGGKACIRGMRISVSLIVNLVANGMTVKRSSASIPTWSQRTSVRPCAMHWLPVAGPADKRP